MRQSLNRQAPFALALGGACLFSLGIVGCARETGLDLAKENAITERANDSILRSRQELASAGSPAVKGLVETEIDERPSLASRWKAPFKSAGNLLKRKSDDVAEDPFLVQKKENVGTESKEAALANTSKPTVPAGKSVATASDEKQVAMADTAARSNAASPKTPMSREAQAALDDFLKLQEPVGVSERAVAVNHESQPLTRKPGTPTRSTSGTRTAEAASVALDDSAGEGVSRTGATSGKARPFPGSGTEVVADSPQAIASARKSTVGTSARNPLAAAPAGVRRNPLLNDAEEPEETQTPARTKQATGREIANLLKKAKLAGEQGEFDRAISYATAASELAEQCSYEFTAREQSPERVVAWLEARQMEAEEAIAAKVERRQIAATRRPVREVAATTTAFEQPSARQIFADEAGATVAVNDSKDETSFREWAAGIGKTPAASGAAPNWPTLSPRELAASDDLWQPSKSEFPQTWTALRMNAAPERDRQPAETRLASAETDAPAFVATAQAEHRSSVIAAARPRDPIVQLGEPTDLAPGADTMMASSGRRGPRLAPPPLSIEDAESQHVVAKSARPSKHARTIWFAVIGGLSVLVLLVFRRWAYRTPYVE